MMKACVDKLLVLLCLFGVTTSLHAAKFQCWRNAEGVKECGHRVPPEYSQQQVEILNEHGVVVDVKERAKTPEELKEQARLDALRKEEEKLAAKQRHEDQILLMTYSNERDLNLAHTNNIDAMNSIIELTRANSQKLQARLTKVEKKAANYERAGEKTPESIFKDMEILREKLESNDKLITKKENDINLLNKQYQKDLERFRELKGIKPKAPVAKSN